ncbi:MAG: hypothetical protein PHT78_13890 [Desulfitobacteriaceae bacterium]|nr:hypothetical protein [Desulfitobacteriaceae bacterium]
MKDSDMNKLLVFLRELISLAEEQRTAMKERNLARFEEITTVLSLKHDQLIDLEKDLNENSKQLNKSPKQQALNKELRVLMEKLQEMNKTNLVLIRTSYDLMRPILNTLMSGSLTYEGTGSIVPQGKKSAVLDRTL